MNRYDIKGYKPAKVLDAAIDLIERDHPELEINIAKDSGEMVEFLLYDTNEYRLRSSLIASYNMWYPGEINYYTIKLQA